MLAGKFFSKVHRTREKKWHTFSIFAKSRLEGGTADRNTSTSFGVLDNQFAPTKLAEERAERVSELFLEFKKSQKSVFFEKKMNNL